MKSNVRILRVTLFVFGWLAVSILGAVQPRKGAASEKFFYDPSLFVPEQTVPLAEIDGATLAALDGQVRALGLAPGTAFYDARAGRWSSLILSHPLIPGSGAGNALTWSDGLAPRGVEDWKNAAWNALLDYLRANARDLKIDLAQLSTSPRISVHGDGDLIFIHVPRVVDGIPVRDNSIGAAINHGNLILLGLQRWGDVGANVPRSPGVSAQAAEDTLRAHVQPMAVAAFVKAPRLELVPVAAGAGIGYRLAWVVSCKIDGDLGNWEGLVDASTGTLLSFQDRNQYADGKITGGAYPVSNDQRPPDGIEQSDWPMPFADFTVDGVKRFTDSGGNMGCIPGSISTALNGIYLKMLDSCGAINEVGTNGIDLGEGPTPGATDCTVPVGHSSGDTKSSRSGFYELNRIAEQARGHLDAGTGGGDWARAQLTANMNMPSACNAFWDGSAVNFFRSALGSGCANTGEIAAIFDHEWGHGMDNNGTNPNIAGPGEAIADIYAALRLNTSCIGRGFFTDETCGGYGDACDGTPANGCTGVRDINYINHRCDAPHTITWIQSGFTDGQCAGPGGAPACPAEGSVGPCGRETHCEGYVMAETGWDLMTRDLLDPPFNYSTQTAHEIAARLIYIGAQPVGNWYTCAVGGGCSATGGYLSVLAADDDNGNLSDGTPHMTAIRAAFERHEIHCATPAPTNSGCVGGPTQAPVVTLEGPGSLHRSDLDRRSGSDQVRRVPRRRRQPLRHGQGHRRRDEPALAARLRPPERTRLLVRRGRGRRGRLLHRTALDLSVRGAGRRGEPLDPRRLRAHGRRQRSVPRQLRGRDDHVPDQQQRRDRPDERPDHRHHAGHASSDHGHHVAARAGRGGPRDLHGRRRRLPDPGAGARVRRFHPDPRRSHRRRARAGFAHHAPHDPAQRERPRARGLPDLQLRSGRGGLDDRERHVRPHDRQRRQRNERAHVLVLGPRRPVRRRTLAVVRPDATPRRSRCASATTSSRSPAASTGIAPTSACATPPRASGS